MVLHYYFFIVDVKYLRPTTLEDFKIRMSNRSTSLFLFNLFGYRRLWAELRKLGYVISENKTQKLGQKLGIQVTCFGHRNRKYNSYKGNVGKVAPNRIHRRFKTSIPHQKITTDTTEFKYYEYIQWEFHGLKSYI